MSRVFEVTADDINDLDFDELTLLLRKLLYLETSEYGLPPDTFFVSLNYHASDSGEDGIIDWDDESIERTDWIPCSTTLFQSKATSMTRSECKNEILRDEDQLKERVEEVFEEDGAYRLFCSETLGGDTRNNCVEGFREGLEEAGKEYAQEVDIEVYDAVKISEWVNEYVNAIIFLHKLISKPLGTPGFKTYEQWSREREHSISEYQTNENLDEIQSQIIQIVNTSGEAGRLLGLSGVGKTRLVMNSFENSDENHPLDEFSLKDFVVYVDLSKVNCDLCKAVQNWKLEDAEAILIVDNCDLSTHRALVDEIYDSSLSLLTIHLNPDEKTGGREPVLEIEPADNEDNEVIKTIVENTHPELNERDIDKIVRFAQGFPKIAVLLANARFDEESRMGSLENDDMVRKLLWPNGNEDRTTKEILAVCSLFEYVGFEGEASEERKKLAIEICDELTNEEERAPDIFYERITPFIRRGIVEKIGEYIRVGPIPLAIRLAADWWGGCSDEKAARLLAEIPSSLHTPLCDRMAKLDFLPEAQDFVSDLCGEMGPFGQAEVLNSKQGSRLFRSLAEVNPAAAVDCLSRTFGDWTREELLEVGPGRRNLIWTLEKICFRSETFWKGTKMLFKFASAENENISNNATGKFVQLFHVLLSGTEVSLEERIKFLKEAIKSNVFEERKLAINAMGEALRSQNFTRDVGAEEQGSGPALQEYRPNNKEIYEYWLEILKILKETAIQETGEIRTEARKKLAKRFREHTKTFLLDDYLETIREVNESTEMFWTEMNKSINRALKFLDDEEDDLKNQLEGLLEDLGPLESGGKISVLIKEGVTKTNPEQIDSWDAARQEAEEFGKEFSDFEEIVEHLIKICSGEVKQGFAFGKGLAENLGASESFLREILRVLKRIESDERNTKFLRGYLLGLQDEEQFIESALKEMKDDEDLIEIYPQILATIQPDLEELNSLIQIIDDGRLSSEQLKTFSTGQPFNHLACSEFIEFIRNLRESLGMVGFRASLDFVFYYTYNNSDRFTELEDEIKLILQEPELINTEKDNKHYSLDPHRWSELAQGIIQSSPDEEFISEFSKRVSEISSQKSAGKLHHSLQPVIEELFEVHPEISWSKFSEVLLSADPAQLINLRSILGNDFSFNDGYWLLEKLPEEKIFEWCEVNGDKARKLIAEMVPLFKYGDESETEEPAQGEPQTLEWNPFVLKFLNRFGSDEIVRKSIQRNLRSFGSVGPRSIYYEKRLQALEVLKEELEFIDKREWIQKLEKSLNAEKEKEETFEKYREAGIFN